MPARYYTMVKLAGGGYMLRLFGPSGLEDKVKALTYERALAKVALWERGQRLVTSDLF